VADPGPRGAGRPRASEPLNDLTGREWIRFTRSWFVANPPPRSRAERDHPAKFPEAIAEEFVRFFTRRGAWVLDPFAGTGTTLVAARRLGRSAAGLELVPRFAGLARARAARAAPAVGGRTVLWVGDARELGRRWRAAGLPPAALVLTSPPYWDILTKSRGGVDSVHRRRARAGLATAYSDDPRDLGNLHDYPTFVATLVEILAAAGELLRPGGYLVVVLQNLRDTDGTVRRLAWEVADRLDRPALRFQGERLWCQDAKPLGIWGYPSTFVPNYHHHYCLIFRRPRGPPPRRRSVPRTRAASPPRSRGAAARSARR
jgi:SAM-dependent methyltransferase